MMNGFCMNKTTKYSSQWKSSSYAEVSSYYCRNLLGILVRILLNKILRKLSKSIEWILCHTIFNVYATDLGEEGVDLARLYDYG